MPRDLFGAEDRALCEQSAGIKGKPLLGQVAAIHKALPRQCLLDYVLRHNLVSLDLYSLKAKAAQQRPTLLFGCIGFFVLLFPGAKMTGGGVSNSVSIEA